MELCTSCIAGGFCMYVRGPTAWFAFCFGCPLEALLHVDYPLEGAGCCCLYPSDFVYCTIWGFMEVVIVFRLRVLSSRFL